MCGGNQDIIDHHGGTPQAVQKVGDASWATGPHRGGQMLFDRSMDLERLIGVLDFNHCNGWSEVVAFNQSRFWRAIENSNRSNRCLGLLVLVEP